MARHFVITALSDTEFNIQESEVTPANGKHFSLEELQAMVGGYIEFVRVISDPNLTLVCNEEGILMGLPFNPIASRKTGHNIFGNVVIIAKGDLEGDE